MLMNMNWKSVKGYEDFYEVSDTGLVRSKDRWVNNRGTMEFRKGHIMHPNNCRGYRTVCFCVNGKTKRLRVARLVAETFIPNPDNKEQIDHINTIRTDDRVENLRWCTRSENMNNPTTKTNIAKTKGIGIKAIYSNGETVVYNSILDAAKLIPMNRETIYRSLNGKIIMDNKIRFEYGVA